MKLARTRAHTGAHPRPIWSTVGHGVPLTTQGAVAGTGAPLVSTKLLVGVSLSP